ncbi:MAG: hypothetical protein JSR46_09310, partial [Verrucomicrobia bacterium]|nr:hypothetical protein [Verrucomicrobiota bacterium]
MVHCIGLASGLGAANSDCGMGPRYFQQHLTLDDALHWQQIIASEKSPYLSSENKYDQLACLNGKFAQQAKMISQKEPFFLAF